MKKIITSLVLLVSLSLLGQNTFPSSGNVGIGTINPSTKLAVNNSLDYTKIMQLGADGPTHWYFGIGNSGGDYFHIGDNSNKRFVIKKISGNVGIGLSDSNAKLEVKDEIRVRLATNNIDKNVARIIPLGYSGITGAMNWTIRGVYQHSMGVSTNSIGGDLDLIKSWNRNTVLATNKEGLSFGNVGIGTQNPDEKLTVKGKIHAEEVRVDLNVPADYVFQKYYTGASLLKDTYKMPTLEEVAAFTKKNHHLPEIPSAAQIQKEGLHLKQMSNLLLQKIEELTIYTIEQEKRINALESKLVGKKS